MTFHSWAKITPHAGTGQESFLQAHKKHIKIDQGLRTLFVFIYVSPEKLHQRDGVGGTTFLFKEKTHSVFPLRKYWVSKQQSEVGTIQATKKPTTSEEPRKQCWVYISIYYINTIRKGRGYFPPLNSGGGGGHFSLALPTLGLRLCLNYLK